MSEDVINFVKTLGVGCRHPKDEFFREGDDINKVHKIFGVHEIDCEEFYHKSYSVFSCHVPGCNVTCETVLEYDQHYNSCHRFSCSQCKKYLPSSHLLDLHLMETHDAYFATLAEKKPMFQCYVQECKNLFQTPQQRRDHCITDHKFPSNFRFDVGKSKNPKPPKSLLKKGVQDVEMDGSTGDQDIKMDVTEESVMSKSKPKTKKKSNFVNKRKPILDINCFVKDLKESLPS